VLSERCSASSTESSSYRMSVAAVDIAIVLLQNRAVENPRNMHSQALITGVYNYLVK
jgi:hypothetical protein